MPRAVTLTDGDWDVVVIGGGMAGAGVARDLALRGVSVALVDKGDFASGTTSRSSKLIHGGLRYLELWDVALVREALREREILHRLAPHLVRPLPCLVPIYRDSSRSLIKVRIGLRLYDWLTPGRGRERSRVLPPVDALSLEPGLQARDLRGAGYCFEDLLLSPERLCLENVLSAWRHGAHVYNYAEVEELVRDRRGRVGAVRVRDLLTGRVVTLRARVVVNATGPWVDELRDRAGLRDHGPRLLRRTKGIHCVLPRLTERAVYHATRDGRMVFVIPWRAFSLVGTTDTDFEGDLERLWATREEVTYLLEEVRRALPDPRVALEQVVYTYAGVRPLTRDEGRRASDVSRRHRIVAEAGETVLSVTGAKLTCYRSLAAALADRVVRLLGRDVPGRTERVSLDGTDDAVGTVAAETWLDVTPEVAASGMSRDTLETLVATYGRGYRRVVELAGKIPGGSEPLCPTNPEIVAQLHVAVHDELAVSLQDVLLRRTGIGTSPCQGLDCAEAIARRMAALCGWTPRRLVAELDAYHAHVALTRRFRT
jgi:glycerol-3-phosphate dehydrogenase